MNKKHNAKKKLDKLIKKSRVHLYKPIQVAEILYQNRMNPNLDLKNVDEYRNKSKKWRDNISVSLVGRKCTSSAKFQDNLFEENAIPPEILSELGDINRESDGGVEAYIYHQFSKKQDVLAVGLQYCAKATCDTFDLREFLGRFWNEPGLKRSLDKVYEIVVYSLFDTLLEVIDAKITFEIDKSKANILAEFSDFAKLVMGINLDTFSPKPTQARVYRVGVTNAADRGLDMYSNWGPVIQIKHLSLDEELAEEIVDTITSDRIVIVCKSAEKSIILSLLNQIGWKSRIQSIITEDMLVDWYDKALRGKFANILGESLLNCIKESIEEEFPSVKGLPPQLEERHYEFIDLNNISW